MHRDDWSSVFKNQDKILKQLKPLDAEIFLAGGTGLQRFVLSRPYRHSEDLDFFFAHIKTKKEVDTVKQKIVDLLSQISQSKLEDSRWIRDEQSWRLFYSFEGNDEIIKIELLNFTFERIKDLSFTNEAVFNTENLYNLLLYKCKALCDRPDTIKDLFDIYFILRELDSIEITTLVEDINKKFEKAINIRYSKDNIITSLNHKLAWDIEIGDHIAHLYGLKSEIESFQIELKKAFLEHDYLNFGFKYKLEKKASEYGLRVDEYIELIEDNEFLVDEYKRVNNEQAAK
ncbi:MAG: nucleotidyl transferase AbiEii/AbiGii toxin family protein [Campylobacterota bacterium]